MKLISREALVNHMEHRKLSQAELARRSGVSPQLINHLHAGRRNTCLPNTAREIEAALELQAGALFVEGVSTVSQRHHAPQQAA